MGELEPGGPRISARSFADRLRWLLDQFAKMQADDDERTPDQWEKEFVGWFDGEIDDISMHDRGYFGELERVIRKRERAVAMLEKLVGLEDESIESEQLAPDRGDE